MLTVNNYPGLYTDIQNRFPSPANTPAQIVTGMNALAATVQGDTTVGIIRQYLAANGLLIPFQKAAALSNGTNQNNIAALYQALLSADAGVFPLSQPYIQALIQSCVAASQLTTAQQSAILALGQFSASYVLVTYASPALTLDDVYAALRTA